MSDSYYEEEEFSSEFNGRTVLRILGVGWRHWPYMLWFLASIGLVAVVDSYFTYLSKRIIDEGILAGDMQVLTQIMMQYASLLLVQAALVFSFIYAAGVLAERVRYDLRRSMFGQIQRLSLTYFDRTPVGWLMARMTSDAQRVGELVGWGLLDTAWGITNIITAMAFMTYINWRLALVVLAILPILVVVAARFKRYILLEYRQVRKLNSQVTGSYNESITGVRVIKSLGREEQNLVEFGRQSGEMYRAAFRAAWLSALFLPAVQIITAVGVGAILWYGGFQFRLGTLTIGGIQAFISYVTFMLWPIQEMARVYAEMQQSIAAGERIFALLDAQPEIQDQGQPQDPGTIRQDIVFEDVDFWYEEGKPVLERFNLHVKQGETVALVGPTGAGKSTLVNLICRFYEPRAGIIRFGEQDYRQIPLHAIHSRIGMVLQTPHLFSGTVRENLRYGRLDATDPEIEAAARTVGAHEFISRLDQGYDTEVGEGGVLLSVGQKQLLSLARAVLAQPDLFIMDEATSSVDTLTEALIQQGMEQLMRGRTSFIIAHRLSTIKRAHRILVIEDGSVVEMGSHAELIRKQGHYYRLYTRQFRDERSREADPFRNAQAVVA